MLQDSEMNVLRMFFIGLFVFFWIYSLLWVAKDVSWRTNHLGTQVLCVFIIVFLTPLIGLPVYFLIRPLPRKDILLEQQEITEMLHAQTIACYACGGANMHEHMYCVFCGEKLKQQCPACKKRYAIGYLYCPFCALPSPDTEAEREEYEGNR